MRPLLILVCMGLTLACTREDARPAKEVVAEAKGSAAEAAQAVQQGVTTAEEKTRTGVDAVANGVRELGQGGVVTGRVNAVSHTQLALRPEGKGPAELRVDGHTRYLLHGEGLEEPHLTGRRVRATYVVEANVPVATEVEVLDPSP